MTVNVVGVVCIGDVDGAVINVRAVWYTSKLILSY